VISVRDFGVSSSASRRIEAYVEHDFVACV
jgi:hypothetical protein